jgi:two-component system LytT family sensor kinase
VVASSAGAALFAREYPGLAGISFWRLALWQAPLYAAWALVVPVVAMAGSFVRSWPRRLAVYAVLGPPLIAAHALFAAWWISWGSPAPHAPRGGLGPGWFVERAPIDLLMYCFIAGTLAARHAAAHHAREKSRADQLERDLVRTELETLKARLQPHFLFNALQSIAVLIRRDPEGATRMTQDLASLLRATLRGSGTTLVPLSHELALVERYVAIEKARFPDRLRVTFDIEPAAQTFPVPDLLLQPLVENAIRHGLAPQEGGEVRISAHRKAEMLLLEVCDDGVGLETESEAGLGLGLTRSRLQALYGERHVLRLHRADRGTRVEIEIPEGVDRKRVAP